MYSKYEMILYTDIVIYIKPRPDPRDLATYIKGPGEAGQGQIEIEPIEYYGYSRYTPNLALFD
jgi:hypothetical protein